MIDEAFLDKKTIVSPKFSRSSNVAFTDKEMVLILEGIIQDKVDGLSVVKLERSNSSGFNFLDITVKNKTDGLREYDLDEIRSYINSIINYKLEDVMVRSITKI